MITLETAKLVTLAVTQMAVQQELILTAL